MSTLNNIPNTGRWADIVYFITDNFNKLLIMIESIKSKYVNQKGYFESETSLNEQFPTPKAGEQAFVNDGTGTYFIYEAVNGVWIKTTSEAPAISVDLANYAEKSELENWIKNW